MEGFSLTIDGLQIRGKLFRPRHAVGAHTTVLFIHGWESKQDRHFTLAEELASKGYTCVTFDMRGHGTSDGDHKMFSRKDFLSDAAAAYDFVTTLSQANGIVVVGSSFGAYLATLLSTERNVQALVLRVPADYKDEGFTDSLYKQGDESSHSLWKSSPHAATETASLRAIHAFKGHILIVESEKDELVPATTVQSYKYAVTDASKLTYVVMKDAPHSISHHLKLQREFADIVARWIETI